MKSFLHLAVILLPWLAYAQVADINWAEFLERSDPVWTILPQKFDHGAFAGNGLIGTTIFQQNPSTLRFAMGRSDVTEHRRDNARLLLGGLTLKFAGKIKSGTLRTHLYDAEIRGTIVTDQGEVALRAYIHTKEPVLLIEAATKGNEKLQWEFNPQTNFHSSARQVFAQDAPHPPATSGAEGATKWYEQKRVTGGSFTVAWAPGASSGSPLNEQRVMLTVADSFPDDLSKQTALSTIQRLSTIPIKELDLTHRTWWHAYYPKSFLSVPDAQIEGFYWIQIYKLASAMRADGPVMDLQGPWNRETGWPRIWWNLNIQMAYSPVYTANHLELGESFTRFLDAKRDNFAKNAKTIWGFDECATVSHTTDYEGLRGDGGCAPQAFINPGDFTWALHLYWKQYRYLMDPALVTEQRQHAFYPLLKGSINLYLHLLTSDENNQLHLPPMHSPEYSQTPVADNNYNLALLRWGCTTLLELNAQYGFNDPQRREWERVLRDLVPYPQDENGFMVGAAVPFERSHRHWSHLLMVWPLHLLSTEQPENKELVEKTLSHWLTVENGKQIYGWSAAAAAHLYATMGDGENAVKQLRSHHNNKRFVMPNTQYIEGSPVYECSLVAASALQYMLLQGWGNTIRIFPAVPAEWATASFEELRAEGAFLVSAIRKDGKTSWIKIDSLAGEPCRIQPRFVGDFVSSAPDKLKGIGGGIYELALKKGESIILYQGEAQQKVVPCDLGEQQRNAWGDKGANSSLSVPTLSLKGALSVDKPATASSNYSKAYDAQRATDGRAETRWSVAQGEKTGWLEIDLQKETTFSRAEIYEFEQRITLFSLEFKEGETWKTIRKGEMIGAGRTLTFEPVKARLVRFNILDSSNGAPSLFEFHLFEK